MSVSCLLQGSAVRKYTFNSTIRPLGGSLTQSLKEVRVFWAVGLREWMGLSTYRWWGYIAICTYYRWFFNIL